MERTLILVKPDAFERNLTGEVIARFERKGLKLVALKQLVTTEELAKEHYAGRGGDARFDPRRLRPRGSEQPRAWFRLDRVVRARNRSLVPRAVSSFFGAAATGPGFSLTAA